VDAILSTGMSVLVTRWTVEYEDGREREIRVPHAWKQDVPVDWEGPATYRTQIEVPRVPSLLRFHGISYHAAISINDEHVADHDGIWDSFDLDLSKYTGRVIDLEVKVTKNGGATYPVRRVLSGFLPYVFNTFGGIFRDVELIRLSELELTGALNKGPASQKHRVEVEGNQIAIDGNPFYMRGVLHWGWYPELGHCNPGPNLIREEVRKIKSLGFNTVKFCLWLPPHDYLQALEEEGMFAWVELPLWDPDPAVYDDPHVAQELEAVIRQYAHHSSIIAWTLGCELSNAPLGFREYWTAKIRAITKCPLVKDNSGGAEMYGGDPREFGTFYDYHPYADVDRFEPLLDSLIPGARENGPLLLGETNDHDAHRDLAELQSKMPFWASALSELNAKGVRWQYDLPGVLLRSEFAHEPGPAGHDALMERSKRRSLFVRRTVTEIFRSKPWIGGYVVTGLCDTPISSAGMFDDWMAYRFDPSETASWNGKGCLFTVPARRPKWTHGGNRAALDSRYVQFQGGKLYEIGFHSDSAEQSALIWKLQNEEGLTIKQGCGPIVEVEPNLPTVVDRLFLELTPGRYTLVVEFADTLNRWPILVIEGEPQTLAQWELAHGVSVEIDRGGEPVKADLILWTDETLPRRPFWRECVLPTIGVPALDTDEFMLDLSTDRVMTVDALVQRFGEFVPLITRIDTRTYEESYYAVKTPHGVVTTLSVFAPNQPALPESQLSAMGGACLKALWGLGR